MSDSSPPHLPPEILDYILDFLHDDRDTLQQSCLTSKSWVPRTRRHLFSKVTFRSAANLESWKQTFPDHSNSPACYTQILTVECPEAVKIADAGAEGGWIRAFSRVVQLNVHGERARGRRGISLPSFSLIPFHGFSPVLKRLSIICGFLPNTQVFDLISTLPLLEDLLLSTDGLDDGNTSDSVMSPTVLQDSPAFTGTLGLFISGGIDATARQLLCLPNGLRLGGLALSRSHERETEWLNALIAGCSGTLRHLSVDCFIRNDPHTASIDISKATKLCNTHLKPTSLTVKWVTQTLQSITHNHRDFQRISIRVPYIHALGGIDVDPTQVIEEPFRSQWLELDHLLAQFRHSRSTHLKVSFIAPREKREKMEECVKFLLPETTKEGTIYLLRWLKRLTLSV